ncbi:hypothetical protein RRG08_034664 [Elysia crispata]|uniref:Uncharacterized protein n=1 Tax=Elysia crispata TaxID=231223 RepID=A0AAE0Z217_9GAST|nr:hypothetical protein RRG08_034664 [Elysia crispata]
MANYMYALSRFVGLVAARAKLVLLVPNAIEPFNVRYFRQTDVIYRAADFRCHNPMKADFRCHNPMKADFRCHNPMKAESET